MESRPMVAWIFQNEEYTALYHQIYAEFLSSVFESGWFAQEIERVGALIAPYVQNDANGFFSYEEFQTGIATLQEFCALRASSIRGQLEGVIPSTSETQQEASGALLDASHINLSDMGEFGMGGGNGGFSGMPGLGGQGNASFEEETSGDEKSSEEINRMNPPAEAPQMKDPFSPQAMKEEVFPRSNADGENSSIGKNNLLLLALSSAGLLCAIAFAVRCKNGR